MQNKGNTYTGSIEGKSKYSGQSFECTPRQLNFALKQASMDKEEVPGSKCKYKVYLSRGPATKPYLDKKVFTRDVYKKLRKYGITSNYTSSSLKVESEANCRYVCNILDKCKSFTTQSVGNGLACILMSKHYINDKSFRSSSRNVYVK